jgi:hypothetical protein
MIPMANVLPLSFDRSDEAEWPDASRPQMPHCFFFRVIGRFR